MTAVMPCGTAKGKPIGDVPEKELAYWASRIRASLSDPEKARYAAANRAQLDVLLTEYAARGLDPADIPSGPPAASPSPTPERSASAMSRRAPASVSIPASASEALKVFAERAILVSPATSVETLPEGCDVAFSMVQISPDTTKDGPGEVYALAGGKVGLSGHSLQKISSAAGVSWDPAMTRRLDDGSDPHYCHYRAVGQVTSFDGSKRTLTGEVEIDMREGSPQIQAIVARARDANGRENQIREMRLFILRHAESKAKNRAIAELGVKRAYHPSELEKPFAVARLMFTGRTNDPELRRIFAEKRADAMLGGARMLFRAGQEAPRLTQVVETHSPPPVGAVTDIDDMTAAHGDDDLPY